MDRRDFLKTAGAAGGLAILGSGVADGSARRPNIVIIMADDMGYSDLSCYGSKAISTPNIDSLATQGVKMTSFFSCSAVCSPSRAGLLTGRYPFRIGVYGVYFTPRTPHRFIYRSAASLPPDLKFDKHTPLQLWGMNTKELTVAGLLKDAGYKTCCVGKWHLGWAKKYRPHHRGFDHYMGVLTANDVSYLPLFRNDEIIEKSPVDQDYLTQKYTREALEWLHENHHNPFFLYFAHTFPHIPLHASPEFRGISRAGLYGDTVEEIDWSVGEILKALDRYGIADNSLVLFTSDNGPWFEGNPGYQRGRKMDIFDGGMRVPGIARFPGIIPAGTVSDEMSMNIDIFSTALAVAGVSRPQDRVIDGRNILPMLKGDAASPHQALFFYGGLSNRQLNGVKKGRWKYHRRHSCWTIKTSYFSRGPMLFDHQTDPNESYNVIELYPEVAREMEGVMKEWEEGFVRGLPD
jgi:arylsulfatase A